MAGLKKYFSSSSPLEMHYFLRPPICKELSKGELRRAGDIGLVQYQLSDYSTMEHAFIYVSEDITYSKQGTDKEFPFLLKNTSTEMSQNGLLNTPKQCLENNSTSGSPECLENNFLSYFRCQSYEEFIQNSKNPNSPLIKKMNKKLDQIECEIGQLNQKKISLEDSETINLIIDSSKILTNYLNDSFTYEKVGTYSKDEVFHLQLINARLNALNTSLMDLQQGYFSNYQYSSNNIYRSGMNISTELEKFRLYFLESVNRIPDSFYHE